MVSTPACKPGVQFEFQWGKYFTGMKCITQQIEWWRIDIECTVYDKSGN